MNHEQARRMFKADLRRRYRTPSEFKTWSCSLLWVLACAVRRRFRHESNVLIYIVDTSKLPDSRIHRALDLLDIYDSGDEPDLLEYCRGEYLIHGVLEDAYSFRSATLDTLIEHGLFKLFPELDAPERRSPLHQWVEYLRAQLHDSTVMDESTFYPHGLGASSSTDDSEGLFGDGYRKNDDPIPEGDHRETKAEKNNLNMT